VRPLTPGLLRGHVFFCCGPDSFEVDQFNLTSQLVQDCAALAAHFGQTNVVGLMRMYSGSFVVPRASPRSGGRARNLESSVVGEVETVCAIRSVSSKANGK
jgi:hypothetical protein